MNWCHDWLSQYLVLRPNHWIELWLPRFTTNVLTSPLCQEFKLWVKRFLPPLTSDLESTRSRGILEVFRGCKGHITRRLTGFYSAQVSTNILWTFAFGDFESVSLTGTLISGGEAYPIEGADARNYLHSTCRCVRIDSTRLIVPVLELTSDLHYCRSQRSSKEFELMLCKMGGTDVDL